MITGVPCSVPDCTNPVRARGLCQMHYYRWSKTGDPGEATRRRKGKRPCRVIDCTNDAVTSDDLCPTHRRRKRLYGDENGMFSTHKQCVMCGEPAMHGATSSDYCETHAWDYIIERHCAGEHAGAVDKKSGYVYLTVGKTRMLAHRAVMERLLGRPLLPREEVHHVNGQRSDHRTNGPLVNFRSGNLELWNKSQPAGQRVVDKVEFAVEILREYAPHLLTAQTRSDVEGI